MSKYKSGVVRRLSDKGLIKPPPFVAGGVQYETLMGSVAYGVSSDSSDSDVYGFCMPPKDIVFPHLAGYIPGFSKQIQKFEQYQEHHIVEKDHGKEWDLSIYSIIKYFRLCMDNNPNMIDSLFTHDSMVLSRTNIADMIRDNRKLFLHKGSWHKFKGYAYSQMHKMKIKEPDPSSKRYESIMKHGYDLKFAYHVVRLIDEAEQILMHGDIDLMSNREQLKDIRRGNWKMKDIEDYFNRKEKDLETLYINSSLRKYPDENEIRQLLIVCLEEYYGDLSEAVYNIDQAHDLIKNIQKMVRDY